MAHAISLHGYRYVFSASEAERRCPFPSPALLFPLPSLRISPASLSELSLSLSHLLYLSSET